MKVQGSREDTEEERIHDYLPSLHFSLFPSLYNKLFSDPPQFPITAEKKKKKTTSEEILQLSQETQYKTDELILGLK